MQNDRLRISLDKLPIVDFVFKDEKILKPYFANARLTSGLQVTRNHPLIDGGHSGLSWTGKRPADLVGASVVVISRNALLA